MASTRRILAADARVAAPLSEVRLAILGHTEEGRAQQWAKEEVAHMNEPDGPTMVCGYEIHPAALLFPPLDENELGELADDIAKNGQREPIRRLPNGPVVDGRSRLMAIALLRERGTDIVPIVRDWSPTPGESVASYVISMNMRRRHLTASERAMVGAALLPMLEEEAAERAKATQIRPGEQRPSQASAFLRSPEKRGKSAKKAAETVGVSTRLLEAAKTIAKASPELANTVRSGAIKVTAAAAEVKRAKREGRAPDPTRVRPPSRKTDTGDPRAAWFKLDRLAATCSSFARRFGLMTVTGAAPGPQMDRIAEVLAASRHQSVAAARTKILDAILAACDFMAALGHAARNEARHKLTSPTTKGRK